MSQFFAGEFYLETQREVTTFCHCARIAKRSGGFIGLTDLDVELEIGDLVYKPSAGLQRSNLSDGVNLEVSNLELACFFGEDGITEADVLRGEFDGSEIRIFRVNYYLLPFERVNLWEAIDDTARLIPLLIGTLGEISTTGRGYSAQAKEYSDRANQQIGQVTSKDCRLRFGSAKCGFNVSTVTHTATITEVIARDKVRVSGVPATNDYLNRGTIEFTSGICEGCKIDVLGYLADGTIILWESTPFSPAIGDTLIAVAGCAHTLAACNAYGNGINYGGEHSGSNYMPGNDNLATGGL